MNETVVQELHWPPARREPSQWPVQFAWLAGGLALSFTIPFFGSDILELPLTAYYLCYFTLTLAFFVAYVRSTDVDLRTLVHRHWRSSLLLGLVAGAFVVAKVLSGDATPGPDGARFYFEIAWRGVLYGAVDAILLTVFPCLVAIALVGGAADRGVRKLVRFVTSLALIIGITGVYHLGFNQFRRDGIAPPVIGNTMISVPMVLTMNPLGSVLAHASMHVAATTHDYETPTFLPPQTEADGIRTMVTPP